MKHDSGNQHDHVMRVVAKEIGRTPESLQDGQRLREDLGMDSVLAMNIIFECEEQFGLTILEDEVSRIQTVRDLRHLIATKIPFRRDELR